MSFIRNLRAFVVVAFLYFTSVIYLGAAASEIDIPFTKFELDNGLDVIVVENTSSPTVTIVAGYHVGSKNEASGKTGFAHLFEHLLFGETEDSGKPLPDVLGDIGVSILNGFTSNDMTVYYEAGPVSAVDAMLWVQAQRMGRFLGSFSQKRLDDQRGVVQNELRQRRGGPYGNERNIIIENTYPEGHPYSWSVGGSIEDLDRVTLEDAKAWFRKYNAPNNATIVLVGDISVSEAREKVEKYFGSIEPSAPIARMKAAPALPVSERRVLNELSNVPAGRVTLIWNTPEAGSSDKPAIDVLATILGGDKSSRFHKKLITEKQLASKISAFQNALEIGGQLTVQLTAREGVSTQALEAEARAVLNEIVADGVTQRELDRAKTKARVRALTDLGNPIGVAVALMQNNFFHDDPGFFKNELERLDALSLREINSISKALLSQPAFVLETVASPNLSANAASKMGATVPNIERETRPEFSTPTEIELSNGLRVVIQNRPNSPLFAADLIFKAGAVEDPEGKFGLAELAVNMLEEGAGRRSVTELNDAIADLGAEMSLHADLELSRIDLVGPAEQFDAVFTIVSDMVSKQSLTQSSLDRKKNQQIDAIKAEVAGTFGPANRMLLDLLFQRPHPYARPMQATGYVEDLDRISLQDVDQFHDAYITPDNATLLLVGDFSEVDIKRKLETKFRNWRQSRQSSDASERDWTVSRQPTRVVLVDRPEASQSAIVAAAVLEPMSEEEEAAFDLVVRTMGSGISSRLGANLREDKGWSYGVGMSTSITAAHEYFNITTSVQTDKTAEAMQEIIKELDNLQDSRPITDTELEINRMAALGQINMSNFDLRSTILTLRRLAYKGRRFDSAPEDWSRIEAVDIDDVRSASQFKKYTDSMVWIIYGDLSKIKDPIEALELGDVEVMELKE